MPATIAQKILARCAENLTDLGSVKLKRMGFAPVNCPTAPNLEVLFYPSAEKIAQRAFEMIRPGESLRVESSELSESTAF